MPNWCQNQIDVTGSKEDIKRFLELVTEKFDFHKILPMPEELEDFTSPVKIVSDKEFIKQEREYKDWLNTPEDKRSPLFVRGITQEMSDNFKKEYGADNWYNWCVNNWGVKWNSSDVSFDGGEDWLRFEFLTPWGPPEGICSKLREIFPDVNITWFYKEPGAQISGWL